MNGPCYVGTNEPDRNPVVKLGSIWPDENAHGAFSAGTFNLVSYMFTLCHFMFKLQPIGIGIWHLQSFVFSQRSIFQIQYYLCLQHISHCVKLRLKNFEELLNVCNDKLNL